MLEFSDTPYRYYPPKPSALIIRLAHLVNRYIALPGPNHRIVEIDLDASRLAPALKNRSARLLFLPNHSTHSDPQIITEVHRRLGRPSSFMAAYDVFERSKLRAWVMQHTGCFSVDREGSDRKSMNAAVEMITGGKLALTIFPEGNVYFTNDRPTPFLEGAAFIGMRAQKQLGEDAPVYAIPVSIKATHIEDQRVTVRERLATVASDIGTEFDADAPVIQELRRIGYLALAKNIRQRGYAEPDPGEPIDVSLKHCAEQLVESLERKIDITPRSADSATDRLRKIRAAIHQVRSDPAREIDHPAAAGWADEAILALRIVGYAGNYAAENPTVDRFAETTEKLVEDLYSKALKASGPRKAFVRLNDPINLTEHLEAFGKKARPVIQALTKRIETGVQRGLDHINGHNKSAGAELFNPE